MSVRNLNQGFYSTSIVDNITINIHSTDGLLANYYKSQAFKSNELISLQIPSYSHTFTDTGHVQAGLSSQLTLPSSSSVYSFPVIISINGTPTVVLLTLTLSTGAINIFADLNGSDFTSGQVVSWTNPISITYILI